MKSYELTYIISSNLTSEEVTAEMSGMDSFIQSQDGVILKSEKTGAQTLAFPIRKMSSGYFATIVFQVSEEHVKGLKEKISASKNILRHFIIVKKPFKEQKKRRMRKPLGTTQPISESSYLKHPEKKEIEKADLEKIDKKLEEILSE